MTNKVNYFQELDRIDVTKHIEKKGRFNYLSWVYAVRELKTKHPTATWTIHEWEGVPFIRTECGYFVKVTVDVDGIEMTQVHPVLDNANKALDQPNAFQINTSIQRCLAKAIALHGLGIHIYAGEDLPPGTPLDGDQQNKLLSLISEKNLGKEIVTKVMGQISNETINKSNFQYALDHYSKQ